MSVSRLGAERGGVLDFRRDSFEIGGFFFEDFVFKDGFAFEGVPEEGLFATIEGCEGLAAGDEFVDFDHF